MDFSQSSRFLTQFNKTRKEIESGDLKPYYLLMGDEPYYSDTIIDLITDKALAPAERDFNQYIKYGDTTTAEEIASIARRFPMMASRQLVIVKEAQNLKKPDDLVKYLENPSQSTVLVLSFTGKSADKRSRFYKTSQKTGVILESVKLNESALPSWIEKELEMSGKKIEAAAAQMLAEYSGSELRKLKLELDKLTKAVDSDCKTITTDDIEKNIGISKEFNTIELCNAIATHDAEKAYKIAYFFGESPKKYPIQMTLGYLYYFFSKVEQTYAIMANERIPAPLAAKKAGIYNPETTVKAMKHYSLTRIMKIISLLKDCDYKSKSNLGGNASESDLLLELISKILA